jgi:hypothetical protein
MSSSAKPYVIKKPKAAPKDREAMDSPDVMTPLLYMDDSVIKGAFYLECCWFHKPTRFSPEPHTHDFDEALAFIGSDPEHPADLNGEVELRIEEETLIPTESCIVFIRKGRTHCPMHVRRADKAIFHFSCGMATQYDRGKSEPSV